MNSIQKAVEALTLGAYDYTLKPADEFVDKLKLSIQNALRERRAAPQISRLREQLVETSSAFAQIIGDSPEMMRVFQMTEKVLDNDATVLILGESGTGKELLARAIHFNGPRAKGPLVILNCAAIPESILESELFGHEKGSFTGADKSRVGKFEQASSGTIFLDEIGDMAVNTQSKVLRALQEREITRVGGTRSVKIDVRVIAATNKDLEQEIEQHRFREDLFYRLSVYPIRIPPLRERRSDIPLLVGHFLHRYSKELGKPIKGFTDEAMRLMMGYDWPGNVRELENAIHRAVILAVSDRIEAEYIQTEMVGYHKKRPPSPNGGNHDGAEASVGEVPLTFSEPVLPPLVSEEGGNGREGNGSGEEGDSNGNGSLMPDLEEGIMSLESLEANAMRRAIQLCNGNVSLAARKLGIGRTTFYRKAEQYGIEVGVNGG
jgi:DNA-binding NtrC family response regulator